jgi:hypothetical protein
MDYAGGDTESFVPDIELTSCAGFVTDESFEKLTLGGLVFLHHKSVVAEHVTDRLVRSAAGRFAVRRLRWPSTEASRLQRTIQVRVPPGRPRELYIVDVDECDTDFGTLIRMMAARPDNQRIGLWARAFVKELTRSTLRRFEAFVVFDMADTELEDLRSVVPMPTRAVEGLRSKGALVYVGASPSPRRAFSLPKPNPAAVPVLDQPSGPEPVRTGHPRTPGRQAGPN